MQLNIGETIDPNEAQSSSACNAEVPGSGPSYLFPDINEEELYAPPRARGQGIMSGMY